MKNYQLKTKSYLLKDQESVKFHVKSADYFATIASVLTIIREKINKEDKQLLNKILNNLIKDSLYLQKNYSIIPKDKNKIHKPLAKENGQ